MDGVFAISPVVNYLLDEPRLLFLFCWAIVNGMFGDIERPKYAMLETERMSTTKTALLTPRHRPGKRSD